MNFAYGGTGIFNTFVNQPNMTTQIDYFQHLVQQTHQDLHINSSTIALLSVAGNDYATYFTSNHTLKVIIFFIIVYISTTHYVKFPSFNQIK